MLVLLAAWTTVLWLAPITSPQPPRLRIGPGRFLWAAPLVDETTASLVIFEQFDATALSEAELAQWTAESYHEHRLWGFCLDYGRHTGWYTAVPERGVEIGIPNALAVPLLLMLPVIAWRRARRHARRLRARACLHCGYDLRATPAAGGTLLDRCPECGADSALELT